MPSLAIPREKIPWHPTIDYGLCTADQECLKFCRHDVFAWDENAGRVVVTNPTGCIVGCDACAQICPVGSISFPSEEGLREALRRLRAEVAEAT
jgi:NAD-dependent dihydropyrimidine dehydrogenase PreA subunit